LEACGRPKGINFVFTSLTKRSATSRAVLEMTNPGDLFVGNNET
jgi:hypothetical protein